MLPTKKIFREGKFKIGNILREFIFTTISKWSAHSATLVESREKDRGGKCQLWSLLVASGSQEVTFITVF